MGPVEESWFAPSAEHQHEENELHLQSKLQEEANYHLFGSRMDRRTKEQAGGSAAYGGEEERRRRVSHDPFAQQRPHEPAQSPAVKGLACAGPGSAAQHPAGLSSHPQPLYQSHGSHKPQGLGARPLDLGAADRRVWYMPSQGHRPSLYKTPVPETDLLGNTPTLPFASLPSRDASPRYILYGNSGVQIGDHNYMELSGASVSVLDSMCPHVKEEPASKYQAIFENTTSLTDKHLDPVRENLGKNWKICARKLGLTESQIDEIDHDYERDGLKEKVYQMLQKWLMREGSKGATVGKLARALYQCSRLDLLSCLIRSSQN